MSKLLRARRIDEIMFSNGVRLALLALVCASGVLYLFSVAMLILLALRQ
jgi:hypothetical protein